MRAALPGFTPPGSALLVHTTRGPLWVAGYGVSVDYNDRRDHAFSTSAIRVQTRVHSVIEKQ